MRGQLRSATDTEPLGNCTVIPLTGILGTPEWVADCRATFGAPTSPNAQGPDPDTLGNASQPAEIPGSGTGRDGRPAGTGAPEKASAYDRGQKRPSAGIPAQALKPPRTSGDLGRTPVRPHAPKGLGRVHAPKGLGPVHAPRPNAALGRAHPDAYAPKGPAATNPGHAPRAPFAAQPPNGGQAASAPGDATAGRPVTKKNPLVRIHYSGFKSPRRKHHTG